MDRVEQQGADLWQKIIEKRAAAGLSEAPVGVESKEYRCPHCMAVLKGPVDVCPTAVKALQRPGLYLKQKRTKMNRPQA
jgi:sirohydrochlorin ferrochelatase